MLRSRSRSIEILEDRIAPAQFFVSPASTAPNALTVQTASGANAENTTALHNAQTASGANAAVLLHAGDTLIFDANGDHKLDASDTVMFSVKSGKSMVFLTDTSGSGAFSTDSITGMAVSNGFSGVVSNNVNVNGSVVTALDTHGNVTAANGVLTIDHSAIAGLSTNGQIASSGDLLAGFSISNIRVTNPGNGASVAGVIATGSATDGLSVSFDGGTTYLTTAYTAGAGASGHGISNVLLANGAQSITAGSGYDSPNGTGGHGGSLVNINILASPYYMQMTAGNGANGKISGGAGGSLLDVHVVETASSGNNGTIEAGSGGNASTGAGGAGGYIANLKTTVLGSASLLKIVAGYGGSAGTNGFADGGNGGSITGINVNATTVSQVDVTAGSGGSGGPRGTAAGGHAGNILVAKIQAGDSSYNTLVAGSGGSGAIGGAGGSIFDTVLNNTGTAHSWTVEAGSGGDASGLKDRAGKGGGVLLGSINGSSTSGFYIQAGEGGGAVSEGRAGIGGAVSLFSVVNSGDSGELTIDAGAGGSLSSGNGIKYKAADGGALSNISVTNAAGGTFNGMQIASGAGGGIESGEGTAGNSGNVSHVAIHNNGAITADADIFSGQGGSPIGGTGNAGNSGNIANVTIDDTVGAANPFEVFAGVPLTQYSVGKAPYYFLTSSTSMTGSGAGTHGGSIGSINGVALHGVAGTHVILGQSDQSTAPNTSTYTTANTSAGNGGDGIHAMGGHGGSISNITGVAGTLDITATGGGGSANGLGEAGGSVFDVHVQGFAHLIAAGNGGSGTTAGAGGSVYDVHITAPTGSTGNAGSIGDFTQTFGVSTASDVMGGLFAGLKGTGGGPAANGSVFDISATQIAAILAGQPAANGITTANAVQNIQDISAQVIGAHTNATHNASETTPGGTYFYNEGGTNTTFDVSSPDGDTAVDGFVLGRTGHVSLPVTPLLVIEV